MTYLFTSNVNVINEVEVNNSVGNPIPISKNTTTNSLTNPLFVSGEITTKPGGATSTSAFGENLSVPVTPVIQLDGIYGLDPNKFQTYTLLSGNVDNDGPLFECNTGNTQYGYGVIRSKRSVRYRPGQGAVGRFTAAFTANVSGHGYSGYTQRAGFFAQEQAIQVGFDGANKFGVMRQDGGKATIYKLKVDTAATGTANVSLTLNNTLYTVPITNGTVNHNAQEIGSFNYGSGWLVNAAEDEVLFLSSTVGPQNGTFSVTDNSAQFTSNLTLLQQGVAHTEYWTYQNNFNLDTLDGNGPSGVILDPSKLNIYQINFRWLGAGEIRFAIEDSNNGDMIFFHHIHYSNRNTTPHLSNPSLKLGYVAASLGGANTNVVVKGASMMGAIEGILTPTTFPDSVAVTRDTGLNTGGTKYHMLSLKNRLVLDSKINTKELVLKSISVGATSAASTPVKFVLYRNVSEANDFQWTYSNKTWASATYSKSESTITSNPAPIFQTLVSPGAAQIIDLDSYRLVISPGDSVSIAAIGSGVISQADVILNWVED